MTKPAELDAEDKKEDGGSAAGGRAALWCCLALARPRVEPVR